MIKAIASLLFATALCAVPLLTDFTAHSATAAIAPAPAPFARAAAPARHSTARLHAQPTTRIAMTVLPALEGVVETPPAPATGEPAEILAASEDDEDFTNADPCADEETAALESAQAFADAAPTAGVAVAVAPIVEITNVFANNAPSTGIAVTVEPVVEITVAFEGNVSTAVAVEAEPILEITRTLASITPSSGEPAQIASATTGPANADQMVSEVEEMNGKDVFDRHGALIGRMINCDDETGLAEVALANGSMIALIPSMLTDMGIGVLADVMAEDVMTSANPSESGWTPPAIETY
jgi:hypothetical protein